MTPEELQQDTRFATRFTWARNTTYPDDVQVYAAADDDLDDDLLEEMEEAGGGRPYGSYGFGMSEVMRDLLSRNPKAVPTNDLKQLQTNLKDQGYLPTTYEPTGTWDPLANSGFRRWNRDVEEQARAGGGALSEPVTTGLRIIGYTLPSKVYQALVGAAKGLVEQGAETLPRIHPGASIPLAGFGSMIDFFRDDAEEQDESLFDRVKDALNPFEDFQGMDGKTVAKTAFEDLGFLLSAASLISGVGGGVAAATSATRAAGGIGKALAKSATMRPPVPAAQPGIIARISAGLTKKVSQSAGQRMLDIAKTHGLQAQMSRPILQASSGLYKGAAGASIGARMAGGLGSGDEDTAIERNIRESALNPSAAFWLDNTAGWFTIGRFNPLPNGAISGAFKGLMGETSLRPLLHVAQSKGDSLGQAREKLMKALGDDDFERASSVLWLRADYGAQRKAGEMLKDLGYVGDEAKFEKAWQESLYQVKRDLKDDIAAGKNGVLNDLLRYSDNDPTDTANGQMAFAGWLEELEGIGAPVERMASFRKAHQSVQDLQRKIDKAELDIVISEGLDGVVTDIGKVFSDVPVDFNVAKLRQEAKTKTQQSKALLARAKKAKPSEAEQLLAESNRLKDEAAAIKKSMPKGQKKRDVPYRLNLVRKYDPANGAPGYATEQDLLKLADEYDRVAADVKGGWATASDNPAGYVSKRDQFDGFVDDLTFRGLISDDMAVRAKSADPSVRVSKVLRDKAKFHSKEVRIEDPLTADLDSMGYKLVASRDDIMLFDEIDQGRKLLEWSGAGDYTRRAAFFETLGLSPFKHTDRSLFALRKGHEQAELSGVMVAHGVKMTGRQSWRKLMEGLSKHNEKAVIDIEGKVASKMLRPLTTTIEAARYKVDVRELGPDDIRNALKVDDMRDLKDPEGFIQDVYDAVKRGAAMGGETDGFLRHPMDALRQLGHATRASGAPGFTDWMRTFHVKSPARAGAIVGGGAGAYVGGAEENSDLWDITKGAAFGAAGPGGLGLLLKKKFPKGTYGYLTDHTHRLNAALRYTLSFAFDAGRYMEQNILAVEHGLPAIFAPQHYIKKRFGEEAWNEALHIWDDVNGFSKGKGYLRVVDDIDRRAFQKGMLGFSPRYHEAAQMYILKKVQNRPNREIEEIVSNIGHYGIGRSQVEKTANFFFFPFSFQKKLLTSLGNFAVQEPGRALLIHDSLALWDKLGMDERAPEFLEKYVPLADQLKRLNNLGYGMSPGRFFLEGIGKGEDDTKTDLGDAAQILTSIFAPSGATTPIAQSMGGLGDSLIHMFVPIAVTGEEVDGLDDIVNRYVPAVRDIRNFAQSAGDQYTAVREGGDPYYQLTAYQDERRLAKADLEPFALAMGFTSVDGFLQSDAGMVFKAQYDAQMDELARKYPSGFRKSQEFENTTAINEQALADIANDPNRSPEEEDLLRIADVESDTQLIGDLLGLPTELTTQMAAQQIRKFALERVDNSRFAQLYGRFFEYQYGPITTTGVAA